MDIFDLAAAEAHVATHGGGSTPAVHDALKARVRHAHAVLFAAPEHVYGLLPLLDAALLAAAGPDGGNAWAGKPAAVIGISLSGRDGGWAQHHLRLRLRHFEMHPIAQPSLVIGHADHAFDRRGRLVDASTRTALTGLLADLARCAGHDEPVAGHDASRPAVTWIRAVWPPGWGRWHPFARPFARPFSRLSARLFARPSRG